MTTTKVKTRKSDQLSLSGPEELFLYNSAKNIWMEGKALYFPGTRNTGQFTRKLWNIFLIQAKMVKSLNISCQQTQTLHRRPDELHRLKPFPPKRKRTKAHQDHYLIKKRVLFLLFYAVLLYFSQTRWYIEISTFSSGGNFLANASMDFFWIYVCCGSILFLV